MIKLKSNYNIQFNCSTEEADKIVMEWLKTNKFILEDKWGENAYYCHKLFDRNKGLQYNIYGNILKLDAWIVDRDTNYYPIESPTVKNSDKKKYKKMLDTLFDKLK